MYELFKLFNWLYLAKQSFGLLPLARGGDDDDNETGVSVDVFFS